MRFSKSTLWFCFLSAAASALQASAAPPLIPRHFPLLESGDYEVVSSNHADVCPQRIRIRVNPEQSWLQSVSVTYTGDCYAWGPFLFECDVTTGVCGTGSESIQPMAANRYHWTNTAYGIWADLARVSP